MPSREHPRFTFRNFVVLCVISLITVGLTAIAFEIFTRIFWPQMESDACTIHTAAGSRFRPNCTAWVKAAEGQWASDHYNACGYRSEAACGPKAPGALRIVFIGSSTTHGLFVSYDQAFATRVVRTVAQDLGRPVEGENLGIPGLFSPVESYQRTSEAIGLSPAVVVLTVSPDDLQNKMDPQRIAARDDLSVHYAKPAITKPKWNQRLHEVVLEDSRAVMMAQHFMFQDTDKLLRIFLAYGNKSDYLRSPATDDWNDRYSDLSILVSGMVQKLRAHGMTLLLVAIPTRPEAAMFARQRQRPGLDAFAFGDRLRGIADKAGAMYVDVMHPMSRYRRPEDLYYVVNGHLTPEGHALVASCVAPMAEAAIRHAPTRAGQAAVAF